jgi:ABC-type bacteriocin/lantibiotic exporter with double-glycine peptidase domain
MEMDGVPLQDCSMASFKRQMGVVFQAEMVLLGGTITENITFGFPGDKGLVEQVRNCARTATIEQSYTVHALPLSKLCLHCH